MKVSLDVECTPEEARRFLGLPDVAPMQAALMAELETRLKANMRAMDAESLWRTWMPVGLQGLEQMQAFWRRFAEFRPSPEPPRPEPQEEE